MTPSVQAGEAQAVDDDGDDDDDVVFVALGVVVWEDALDNADVLAVADVDFAVVLLVAQGVLEILITVFEWY